MDSSTSYPLVAQDYNVGYLIEEIRDRAKDFFNIKTTHKNSEFIRTMQNVTFTVKKLDLQSEVILSVIEGFELNKDLSILGKLIPKISKKENICQNVLGHLLSVASKYLLDLFDQVNLGIEDEEVMNNIKILDIKLDSCVNYIPRAALFDPNDLFCLGEEDSRMMSVKFSVDIKQLRTPKEVEVSRLKVNDYMAAVLASLYHQSHQQTGALSKLKSLTSFLFYRQDKAQTRKIAQLYQVHPDSKMIHAFDTVGQGFLSLMGKLSLPSVQESDLIYIPRLFENDWISRAKTVEAVATGEWKDSSKSLFNNEVMPSGLGLPVPLWEDLKTKKQGTIPIRILADEKLTIPKHNSQEDKIQPELNGNELIIHVHGGDWVSMSSDSHQIYTRAWAKMTGYPIFSIDYLTAENGYPAALNDVWEAYNWIINYAEHVLAIKPERIVLIGDSAGGNLIAALTLLLIKTNRRVPDGILLSYPALNLEPNHYTPSYTEAIEDFVLSNVRFEKCRDAYLGDNYHGNDPLASPILAPDYLLKQFPPVRIMVGDRDIYHDDCWRLMDRLVNLGRDAKMVVLKGMPHGFLLFAKKLGIPEANIALKIGAQQIVELMGKKFE